MLRLSHSVTTGPTGLLFFFHSLARLFVGSPTPTDGIVSSLKRMDYNNWGLEFVINGTGEPNFGSYLVYKDGFLAVAAPSIVNGSVHIYTERNCSTAMCHICSVRDGMVGGQVGFTLDLDTNDVYAMVAVAAPAQNRVWMILIEPVNSTFVCSIHGLYDVPKVTAPAPFSRSNRFLTSVKCSFKLEIH